MPTLKLTFLYRRPCWSKKLIPWETAGFELYPNKRTESRVKQLICIFIRFNRKEISIIPLLNLNFVLFETSQLELIFIQIVQYSNAQITWLVVMLGEKNYDLWEQNYHESITRLSDFLTLLLSIDYFLVGKSGLPHLC